MNRVLALIARSGRAVYCSVPLQSPKMLRVSASRARARGDWTSDTFYRRKICSLQPGRGSNWLQLGHSLKEMGCFALAEEAYLKAVALDADKAECALQLAYLAKIRGRFDEAERYFREALQHGYPAPDGFADEFDILHQIDNSVIHATKIPGLVDDEPHIYLSAPVAAVADSGSATRPSSMGTADYSYAFAMRGFIRALDSMGRSYTILRNPEFVSDIREQSNAQINIHLGFYPAERIRLLKGAYNINCIAWEFDRLRLAGESQNYHAFADQTEMLNLADEIWVPSTHGARAVAETVSTSVHMISAPIIGDLREAPRLSPPEGGHVRTLAAKLSQTSWQPLAIFSRIQSSVNAASAKKTSSLFDVLRSRKSNNETLVFVTVLNVHDWRKQLYPLLEGFAQVRKTHPEALLLIKMTTPFRGKHSVNTFILHEQVEDAGSLPRPIVSDSVWITDNVFSRDEMNALFDLSAYYVCTSYAEGQNLPLLEAMGRGSVPVSVNHTAMADYVSEETGIVIASERRDLGPRLAVRYGLFGLQTNFVEAVDVQRAVERAASLTHDDYAKRSAASLRIVKEKYGAAPLMKAIDRVIESIQNSNEAA